MLSIVETATARSISLLTVDVKTRKFVAVSREAMEEALKALNMMVKVMARRSYAMWDILLASEEAPKPPRQ